MKYFELDKKEKEILADFDKGGFASVKKIKSEKAKYQNYARMTLGKSKKHETISKTKTLLLC